MLTDGDTSIELYLLRDHPHAVGLLMAYLPKQKLLIQADSFIPRRVRRHCQPPVLTQLTWWRMSHV